METNEKVTTDEQNNYYPYSINTIGYVGLTLLGIGIFLVDNKYSDLITFMGLALVCDPFDPSVAWPDRPMHQKALPIIQLIIIALVFGIMIASK